MSTVSNSVNSINSVNSVNSYSAVLPPSPMVFFLFWPLSILDSVAIEPAECAGVP